MQQLSKKWFLFSLPLLLMTGCAQQWQNANNPPQFTSANRVVDNPVVINPPPLKMNYQLSYSNNPALAKAYQTFLRTGYAPNIVTDGFVQFAYGTGVQPIIATNPFEETVISLEPGEQVRDVTSGDPQRWSYSLAYSGQGRDQQAHVLVKPSFPDISTDLVITTNERLYTLKMVSKQDGRYDRNVSFWYPEELQNVVTNYNNAQAQQVTNSEDVATLTNLSAGDLNFNYSITSRWLRAPAWKPTRVFDDGKHTYIQFPPTLSSGDMPALFIVNGNAQELVNYRSKPPYFVVDKIFQQAVLVMGVGREQQTVIITNNNQVG